MRIFLLVTIACFILASATNPKDEGSMGAVYQHPAAIPDKDTGAVIRVLSSVNNLQTTQEQAKYYVCPVIILPPLDRVNLLESRAPHQESYIYSIQVSTFSNSIRHQVRDLVSNRDFGGKLVSLAQISLLPIDGLKITVQNIQLEGHVTVKLFDEKTAFVLNEKIYMQFLVDKSTSDIFEKLYTEEKLLLAVSYEHRSKDIHQAQISLKMEDMKKTNVYKRILSSSGRYITHDDLKNMVIDSVGQAGTSYYSDNLVPQELIDFVHNKFNTILAMFSPQNILFEYREDLEEIQKDLIASHLDINEAVKPLIEAYDTVENIHTFDNYERANQILDETRRRITSSYGGGGSLGFTFRGFSIGGGGGKSGSHETNTHQRVVNEEHWQEVRKAHVVKSGIKFEFVPRSLNLIEKQHLDSALKFMVGVVAYHPINQVVTNTFFATFGRPLPVPEPKQLEVRGNTKVVLPAHSNGYQQYPDLTITVSVDSERFYTVSYATAAYTEWKNTWFITKLVVYKDDKLLFDAARNIDANTRHLGNSGVWTGILPPGTYTFSVQYSSLEAVTNDGVENYWTERVLRVAYF